MSYTTILGVPQSGPVFPIAEIKNGLNALVSWNRLALKYLREPDVDECLFLGRLMSSEYKSVWSLAKDDRLRKCEAITLVSTFDHVIAELDQLPEVSEAFLAFNEIHSVLTLKEQSDVLMRIHNNDPPENIDITNLVGVCWIQTSVAGDVWDVVEGDEEPRPYDISRDDNHFFMFEDYAEHFNSLRS